MVLLSVLPVGLLQTWAAVDKGYWYARSSEFLHTPWMDTLRWMRVLGDTVFAVGAVTFVVAVAMLTLKRISLAKADKESVRSASTRDPTAKTHGPTVSSHRRIRFLDSR